MCKAFSGLVLPDAKVFWKFGVDSHTDLVKLAGLRDNTSDPAEMAFARFEITPTNDNYVAPDGWQYRIDESITPAWAGRKHESAAFAAHKQWLRKLNKILVRKEIIHPFEVKPPAKITAKHVSYLRQWASVRDSVRDSVWDSVWASVGASVGDSVWDSVLDSVWASVWPSVWASVWASGRASVLDSGRASVLDSGRASVLDSGRASVLAYTGSFFVPPKWKHVTHKKGEYSYVSLVKLWERGLVPSFDGTTWRLHGGKKSEILYSITADELGKG